jgi:hypothetical protein
MYGEILNGNTEPNAAMISMAGRPIRGGRPYIMIVITTVAQIPAFTALKKFTRPNIA